MSTINPARRRKIIRLALAAGAAGAVVCVTAGCQRRVAATPPDPVASTPITVDEGMRARDWPQQSARYVQTGLIAGPTGFLFEPEWNRPEYQYVALDLGVFATNVVLMPVAFFQTPPWAPVTYRASTVEPTYTAMPPLPPDLETLPVPAPAEPMLPPATPPAEVVPEPTPGEPTITVTPTTSPS